MLHQFPFLILGFHCDNGSEFINHQVAAMLNKLLVEFTKSRAYRTTDNALVEGKNGAVVRKHIGYGPIGAEHAEAVQKFYTAHLNPYLNYHRPCGFAKIEQGKRGKNKRVYPADDYKTPYEKLTSLAEWQQYLKPGITVGMLQQQATRISDTQANAKGETHHVNRMSDETMRTAQNQCSKVFGSAGQGKGTQWVVTGARWEEEVAGYTMV